MKTLTQDLLQSFTLNKLDGKKLIIGMTTRQGGESTPPFSSLNLGLHVHDNEEIVVKNRKAVATEIQFPLDQWVCAEQIHSTKIMEVDEKDIGKGVYDYPDALKGTDGLYTKRTDVLLTAAYADCVPLFFAVEKPAIIGIAHAGWKGTTGKIAAKMIERLQESENVNPKDVHVYIGPSISSCCYEVDKRVIEQVRNCTVHNVHTYSTTESGYMLNLKEVNKQVLIDAGVNEHHITMSSFCTSCDNDLFFSHRKEKGQTGRMFGFIGMKQED